MTWAKVDLEDVLSRLVKLRYLEEHQNVNSLTVFAVFFTLDGVFLKVDDRLFKVNYKVLDRVIVALLAAVRRELCSLAFK